LKSKFVLFILGLLVWLGLSWPIDVEDLGFGIIVAAFVAYVVGDMFEKKARLFAQPSRYIWFLYYVFLLVVGYFKAGCVVLLKVVQPEIPLKPGIVKVKTKLKNEIALTFLANSITLTSDALTVDIDKENGFLYAHWLDVVDEDVDKATQILVARFEKVLERIFE